MVKCNNCEWVGNEEGLIPLFMVEGVGYTATEVNRLNLSEEVGDMANDCPVCKSDDYLSDLPKKEDLKLFALKPDEVGTISDNDQLFYQKGFVNMTVAGFIAVSGDERFDVEIVNCGEQRIFVSQDSQGDLLAEERGGEFVQIHDEPETLLEAMKLEKESGLAFVRQGDSCWLDIEVSKGGKKIGSYYDCFGSVFGSVCEAINAVCDEDLSAMTHGAEETV